MLRVQQEYFFKLQLDGEEGGILLLLHVSVSSFWEINARYLLQINGYLVPHVWPRYTVYCVLWLSLSTSVGPDLRLKQWFWGFNFWRSFSKLSSRTKWLRATKSLTLLNRSAVDILPSVINNTFNWTQVRNAHIHLWRDGSDKYSLFGATFSSLGMLSTSIGLSNFFTSTIYEGKSNWKHIGYTVICSSQKGNEWFGNTAVLRKWRAFLV